MILRFIRKQCGMGDFETTLFVVEHLAHNYQLQWTKNLENQLRINKKIVYLDAFNTFIEFSTINEDQ